MSTNERETEMDETIYDFEEALDIWGRVTDANGLVWFRGEDGRARLFWMVGDVWGRPNGGHYPVPPFTDAYEQEEA